MNRLTDDNTYKSTKAIVDGLEAEGRKVNLICERRYIRLAEYERTGLMPEEINKWIDVNDRLPKDRTDVLVLLDPDGIRVGWYDRDEDWWNVYGYVLQPNVICWMLLPEMPKEMQDDA